MSRARRYAGAREIRARLAAKKMAAEAQMPADGTASARCSNPECRHIRPRAVARRYTCGAGLRKGGSCTLTLHPKSVYSGNRNWRIAPDRPAHNHGYLLIHCIFNAAGEFEAVGDPTRIVP
jgi:hypothetical protein